MSNVVSPLRYPGGKTRAVNKIALLLPEFSEYREPFLGGGSVFMYVKQNMDCNNYWINDVNQDLMAFWIEAQKNSHDLAEEIQNIKDDCDNYRDLFFEYKYKKASSSFEKAVKFFILNRLTFSGVVGFGGYSGKTGRFTDSSIDRIRPLSDVLQSTLITHFDYMDMLRYPGDNVFLFLDPPYYDASKSKLYGKNGRLHLDFDFEKFAMEAQRCDHKWLITHSDTREIRDLFQFANIKEFDIVYGMDNVSRKPKRARELFITNY